MICAAWRRPRAVERRTKNHRGNYMPHERTRGREGGATWRLAMHPMAYCVMLACSELATANPTGAQVAAGAASFSTTGKNLTVTNAPGTVINWNAFSIGRGEIT